MGRIGTRAVRRQADPMLAYRASLLLTHRTWISSRNCRLSGQLGFGRESDLRIIGGCRSRRVKLEGSPRLARRGLRSSYRLPNHIRLGCGTSFHFVGSQGLGEALVGRSTLILCTDHFPSQHRACGVRFLGIAAKLVDRNVRSRLADKRGWRPSRWWLLSHRDRAHQQACCKPAKNLKLRLQRISECSSQPSSRQTMIGLIASCR